MKSWRLFHIIGLGGEESALVRAFIVERSLTDQIEFSNIAYDTAREDLRAAIGSDKTPTLVAEGRAYIGKDAILNFLGSKN